MSLARTALRLAVVMALTNARQAPFPTLAGNDVYDSRMDPVQGAEKGELLPHIVIYTDEDQGRGLSNNNGGPPFGQTVDLVFDLTIGMYDERDGEGGVFRIETEPALEGVLDLLEEQVLEVFRTPRTVWAQRLFAHHIVRIDSWNSRRFVEREAQVRLAGRQIIAQVFLQPPDDAAIVTTAAPAALPEPLAGLVDAIIDDDGPGRADAEYLRDLILSSGVPGAIVLPDLETIRIKESDGGGGKRPDGVAEVTLPT